MGFGFGRNKAYRSLTDEPRKYRIELTLFGIIGISTVILLGLIWVFILGVLVGRGYQPESAIPQLERILPQPSAENAAANKTVPGVLKPEELDFYEALKEEPKPEPEPAVSAKQAPQLPKAPSATSDTEKAPEKQKIEKPQTVQKTEQKPEEPTRQPEAATSANVYRYVYQTASFREIKMAERLKARIEELGFESVIEVSEQGTNSWNRVNVIFVGAPEDTNGLKEKLVTLGIEKPLLRSKVPLATQNQ